jgi:hypothetical protein
MAVTTSPPTQPAPTAVQLEWGFVVVISFASVSMASTFFAMLLTFIFKDRASFLFSQPSFLGVLLLGICLLQMSQIFLAFSLKDAEIYSGSSASCRAYLWLFWFGCSLALSAQCARLYRALLVFRERSLRRPKLNTSKFFISLAALAMIPMGLMMIRMLTDPVQIDQGTCLPLEVASNPNSVVIGLFVRLTVWGLLVVCIWFTRILERLGATVDDAKIQSRLFFWIFFVDAIITGMQTNGLPQDHVAILLSGVIAYGTMSSLYAVYSIKLARLGLNGKEMLIILRREKETRELQKQAFKLRPIVRWPSPENLLCCNKLKSKDSPVMEAGGNPQEMQFSSRAPRQSMQQTDNGDGGESEDDAFGNDPFMSDAILASMASRPVSRVSLRLGGSVVPAGNQQSSVPILIGGEGAGSIRASLNRDNHGSATVAPVRGLHETAQRGSQRRPSSNANDLILASINNRATDE